MKRYVVVIQESVRDFFMYYQSKCKRKIVSLSLLKFKDVANATNLEIIKSFKNISVKKRMSCV